MKTSKRFFFFIILFLFCTSNFGFSQNHQPIADTVVFKSTENLSADKEHVLVTFSVIDKTRNSISDEEIILIERKTHKVLIGRTDALGEIKMRIPKGEIFDLNFKRSPNHALIFYPKDQKVSSVLLEIGYDGTANIEKWEKEKLEEIERLKLQILGLNAAKEKTTAEMNAEIENISTKYTQLRETTIREYERHSNYLNDKKKYLSLEDALETKSISYVAKGSSGSTHYITPITIHIQNNKGTTLYIMIENGRQFISVDTSIQNLIITKKELIVLAPNEEKTIVLHAMCTQNSNSSPSDNNNYVVAEMANENLLTISRCIEKNEYYESVGQRAVWVFTDNSPVDMVASFNNEASEKLQELIRILTMNLVFSSHREKLKELNDEINQVNDEIYRTVDERYRNYSEQSYRSEITGFFEYSLKEESEVMIGMFDIHGIIVRELLYNPNVKKGEHRFDFSFDSSLYTDKKYLFKLLVNSEVKKQLSLGRK
jgi:hypothetical protein